MLYTFVIIAIIATAFGLAYDLKRQGFDQSVIKK
jgi:hypothetical protein